MKGIHEIRMKQQDEEVTTMEVQVLHHIKCNQPLEHNQNINIIYIKKDKCVSPCAQPIRLYECVCGCECTYGHIIQHAMCINRYNC